MNISEDGYPGVSKIFIFVLIFVVLSTLILSNFKQYTKASSQQFTQSNWVGGGTQTNFSDSTKFLNSTQVINTAPNQLTLNPQNLGTGLDGQCLVNNYINISQSSCSGRSTPDAPSFAIGTDSLAGSMSILAVQPTTYKKVTAINSTCGYNDSQSTTAKGPDGFLRIVAFDFDCTSVMFVQCLNLDCSSNLNTPIVTDLNYIDGASIAMGLDGLPRIAYITYNSPNEFHFVRCTNASCTTKIDTLVESASSGFFYSTSIAIGSDGLARLIHDEYGSSMLGVLYLNLCANADCTSSTKTTLTTAPALNDYVETTRIELASDNTPRIFTGNGTSNRKVLFIACSNQTCTSKTQTDISSVISFPYTGLALTPSNQAFLTYQDNNGINFVICNNTDCSLRTSKLLMSGTGGSTNTIKLNSSGIPIILSSTNNGLLLFECSDTSCSTFTTKLVNSLSSYPSSFVLDSNNKPLIFGEGASNPWEGFVITETTGTQASTVIGVGDEILIIDLKGTSGDFANIGKYETHYITGISGNTITLDSPLLNTYMGSTHKILVQRIPQYTNVNFGAITTPTTSGLIGHWKMDEASWNGTANEVVDSSGNGKHGTATNATTSANGRLQRSGVFRGSASYISIPNYTLGADGTYPSFTLSAWVNATSKTTQSIFGDNQRICEGLELNSTDIRLGANNPTTNCVTWSGSRPDDNEWHLITVTVTNSATAELYVDGVSKGTKDISGFDQYWGTGNEIISKIGRSYTDDPGYFNGMIDDARIYSRALTANEVAAMVMPQLTVKSFSSISNNGGILAFRATGSVSLVNGSLIDVSGKGFNGGGSSSGGETYNGNGGSAGTNGTSGQGGGGGAYAAAAGVGGTGTVGGAGGGGANLPCSTLCAGGGGGGYGTTGNGDTTRGASNGSGSTGGNGGSSTIGNAGGGGGGGTYGASNLAQIYFGSGGGGSTGNGGNGGGILMINANTFSSSGIISSNGGFGVGVQNGGGGGGGAGGSILLKGNNISLSTTQAVGAIGGDPGLQSLNTGFGGTGGLGRIALYSPNAINGTTSPSYGTASPIGYSNSGLLTSSIYDSTQSSDWGVLDYTSTLPANTYSFVKVRTSNDANMTGATDFSLCAAIGGGNDVSANSCVHDGDRYVQYQVLLATNDLSVTPTFTNFTLNYTLYIPPTPSPTATPTSTPTSTPIYIAQNSPTPTDTPSDTPTPEITTTIEPTTEPGVIPFIRLKILDPNGNPIKNILVKLKSGSTELQSKTDNNGIVEFKNVKVGDYKVTYTYNGSEYTQDLKVENKDINNTKEVTTPKDLKPDNFLSLWQYICCGVVLLLILGIIGFLINRRKENEDSR